MSSYKGADQIADSQDRSSQCGDTVHAPERPFRRIALWVEYQGTQYHGFQLQLNQPTIQGALEEALARFTGEQIRVRGASRTDSGAHAQGQVVDFLTGSGRPTGRFPLALNYFLPEDIRVLSVLEVAREFHSRRWATSRVYRYRLLLQSEPTALLRHTHLWVREQLDAKRMAAAAAALVGTHDFRAITAGHPKDRSAVRTVKRWEVFQEGNALVLECEANGFLKQQIRKANAILVEIGKGKQPIELMEQTILGVPGLPEIPLLPARGLILIEVKYPEGALDSPPSETGSTYEKNQHLFPKTR